MENTNTQKSDSQIILINPDVSAGTYGTDELYKNHLFEQYKIYVEMTDKTSDRRNQVNAFFLTMHSVFLTGIGLLNAYSKSLSISSKWIIFFPTVLAIYLCYIWWRVGKSYKQLNTAKYHVIGLFEKQLPSGPFVSAEWTTLGKGENKKLYWSVSALEARICFIFALFYIVGALWFVFW